MRGSKTFLIFLASLSLIAFTGNLCPLLASSGPSHSTHFVADNGPHISLDETGCYVCHGNNACSKFADNEPLETTTVCDPCHSPQGAYDGVGDLDPANPDSVAFGAKYNWDSGVYEGGGGTLQAGKDKWCSTCHDQDHPETRVQIEDFEEYTDDASLQTQWKRAADARLPLLDSSGGPDGSKSMIARVLWSRTSDVYGVVKKTFTSPMDLTDMDYVNFFVKADNGGSKINRIRVRLVKYPENDLCAANFITTTTLVPGAWKLVSIPRSSFNDTTWGLVSEIQFRLFEANSGLEYEEYVYFDDIYFSKALPLPGGGGPNVIGDNETYGYFVTGHKFRNCTWCHDSTKPHIDGQTLPLLEYIKNTPNPTNFRLYDDPTKGLTLPYNGYDDYVPGAEGSFALCYGCHDESNILDTSDFFAVNMNTNFRHQGVNDGYCGMPRNLHYLHLVELFDSPWASSCVHCHDPHGEHNPAMTRKEMAASIYFDPNGCEIEQGADSDEDGIDDWHDPDVNTGLALQDTLDDEYGNGLDCSEACHMAIWVTAPNEPPCDPGNNPYPYPPGCLHGYYIRDYVFVPHSGGPCEDCHGQDPGYGGATGGAGTYESHSTHTENDSDDIKGPNVGCAGCHDTDSYPDFTDHATTLAATTACNECHSPDGAFDGVDDPVIGAKANWGEGVYEPDGECLKPEKEEWCATCHDEVPAASTWDGLEPFAPNVIGDYDEAWGTYYGFYSTGHNMDCLLCHDASQVHIDGDARTYYRDSYPLNYRYGYRLPDCPDCMDTMPNGWAVIDFDEVCFNCHNRDEVTGKYDTYWNTRLYDISHTNFADLDLKPYGYKEDNNRDTGEDSKQNRNLHILHMGYGRQDWCDTDFDGTAGDPVTCIVCHNVHGARNSAMIRSGELISTPDTTDKVPALDFTYLTPGDNSVSATFVTNQLLDGDYYVYARWAENDNRATNAPYTIYYSGDNTTVRVNQRKDGAEWVFLGTFPFTAGTDYEVVLSDDDTDGFIVADAIGFDSDGVFNPDPELVVDNSEADFNGDWLYWDIDDPDRIGDEFYGVDFGYSYGTVKNPYAKIEDTVAGLMQYPNTPGGAFANNHVCADCHSGKYIMRVPPSVPTGLWPKVLDSWSDPSVVPPDGVIDGVTLSVRVVDTDDNAEVNRIDGVTVDLSEIGGDAAKPMSGPVDDIYTCQAIVPSDTLSPWTYYLPITAVDIDGLTSQNYLALEVVIPGELLVDNADAAFVGDWLFWDGMGEYGDDFQYITGTASDTATFEPDIPSAGNYEVYAYWQSYPNRATDAPYTIYYNGGANNETVRVNQQLNNCTWVLLGEYSFTAGTAMEKVVLSGDADGVVVADAIKLMPVP